ncbi:MAG: metallophosphoesterase family protein [Rubrivivax sp.]
MRIAVVSDIHGNLPALQAVVRDIQRRGVDTVFNLGDSLSGPLLPLQTAQFLMAQDWLHLAGNHERQVLTQGPGSWSAVDAFAHAQLGEREFAWMASLKPSLAHSDAIYLCHATPASDLEYFLESVEPGGAVRIATPLEVQSRLGDVSAGLVLCGHTHRPRVLRSASGQLIVNPGSVGLQAFDDDHPWAHVIESGSPDARYAMVERIDGEWLASLITVPYGHDAMARLALQNGLAAWAHAVRTGYMPGAAAAG